LTKRRIDNKEARVDVWIIVYSQNFILKRIKSFFTAINKLARKSSAIIDLITLRIWKSNTQNNEWIKNDNNKLFGDFLGSN